MKEFRVWMYTAAVPWTIMCFRVKRSVNESICYL